MILILWGGGYAVISHADVKKDSNGTKKNLLNDKQISLLDAQAAKTLLECHFIYHKKSIGHIKESDIYECVDRLSYWFWSSGNYKILGFSDKKINLINLLDDYMGSRLIPYVLELNKLDQERFLKKIALYYSNNVAFIKILVGHGISVKNVLLQQVGEGGGFWASCKVYTLFLNKNLKLYKENKTLYESVPAVAADELKGLSPFYRWEDLHHLSNPTYNICPDAIEKLARANPALLNKRQRYGGDTPLHLYLSGLDYNIKLVNTLTTAVNMNMKNNRGNTPLHEFLINNRGVDKINKNVIEMMIARGANINIKNNKGVTVKDLILKRPDLSGFFK